MSGSAVFGTQNQNFTFYRRYRYFDTKVGMQIRSE